MHFQLIKSGKHWRWRLVARNGKILAHSERYTRKRAAWTTADTVRATMDVATPIVERQP